MIGFCVVFFGLPPIKQKPVAPHCQGAMRKGVPTGSEQMLIFEFLTSGAQLPYEKKTSFNDLKKKKQNPKRQKKKRRTEAHSASNLQISLNSFVG